MQNVWIGVFGRVNLRTKRLWGVAAAKKEIQASSSADWRCQLSSLRNDSNVTVTKCAPSFYFLVRRYKTLQIIIYNFVLHFFFVCLFGLFVGTRNAQCVCVCVATMCDRLIGATVTWHWCRKALEPASTASKTDIISCIVYYSQHTHASYYACLSYLCLLLHGISTM